MRNLVVNVYDYLGKVFFNIGKIAENLGKILGGSMDDAPTLIANALSIALKKVE